ncbi:MAG: hypothetical protein JWP97_6042 [Labilithrix sp.]|nr:hypothetical protein [Labilithrix sp.]
MIANHYTEPPAELPIRYHEVVSASLVRRGLAVLAAPFDMVLDAELPVELGRQHYGMPKRLAPELRLVQSSGAVSAHAQDLDLEAREHGAIVSALAWPLRVAFGLGVRLVTGSLDVVGDAYPPAQRARIALVPRGAGRSHRLGACTAQGHGLRALWCQAWDFTTTVLGAPAPFIEGGA